MPFTSQRAQRRADRTAAAAAAAAGAVRRVSSVASEDRRVSSLDSDAGLEPTVRLIDVDLARTFPTLQLFGDRHGTCFNDV